MEECFAVWESLQESEAAANSYFSRGYDLAKTVWSQIRHQLVRRTELDEYHTDRVEVGSLNVNERRMMEKVL